MTKHSQQNLWGTAKVVLGEKFIAIQVFIKSQENLKQPNLSPKRIRKKKKKELAKPKVRRRKGILKIGEEINKRD